MKELLASGRFSDLALAVIAIEAIGLLVMRRRLGRGMRPLDVMGQLLAGAMLMLAMRSLLTGADYRWTLVFLTASFPAHIFDLVRRARSGRADSNL